MKYKVLLVSGLLVWLSSLNVLGQRAKDVEDSIMKVPHSKFDFFNKKAEVLFQYVPFPVYSYAQETGQVFGLVKYNLLNLVKDDTVSTASSFTALASVSSIGLVKFVLRSSGYLNRNKVIIRSKASYINFPQQLYGVGNEVTPENEEQIKTASLHFANTMMFAVNDSKTLYVGFNQDFKTYDLIDFDSVGYMYSNQIEGYQGGAVSKIGPSFVYDTRDNRYTSSGGMYLEMSYSWAGAAIGSEFDYSSFGIDFRKFIKPWYNHVIAFQFHTAGTVGEVPFYSLNQLGGSDRMRGYFSGELRDKTILDTQVEYRMPVWNIIGVVAFASTGRVAPDYSSMTVQGLWYGGGLGLRIRVDSKNNANLRLDYGLGQEGASAFVVAFTEAF
ncbi:Surface antigen [Reichenbachiella agariperforans]|uniref:Surface antigen n=1 Tax=Reichenbachiella agariperforans TaxID=156994 RepID=A0A1M6N657_REIAG|nr:BamA/TamA family outer membrane protein [Reichenbachiella agariperforans]SHJ91209.1 Surface antigen [Reichenbachiella agariperforans]